MEEKNVPSNSTKKLSSIEKSDFGNEDKGVTKKGVGSNFTASFVEEGEEDG